MANHVRLQPPVDGERSVADVARVRLARPVDVLVGVERGFRLRFEVALIAEVLSIAVHAQVLVEMLAGVESLLAVRLGAVKVDDLLVLHGDVVLARLLGDELQAAVGKRTLMVPSVLQRSQVRLFMPAQRLRFLEFLAAVAADELDVVRVQVPLEAGERRVNFQALRASQSLLVGEMFLLVDQQAPPSAENGAAIFRAAAHLR